MRVFTVLLEDGTTGTITEIPDLEGMTVTVELYDENGNLITKTGKVKEVL